MILVLGGTSDSIGICNKLNEMNLPYMVSVTTEYGRDIAKKATENVFLGKLTIEDMVSLIKEKNITQIIDATHPYATIVSSNAIECSKISNTDYVRFERESLIKQIDYDDIYVVEDIEQACEIANEKGNNIFIGTGSKNLDKYIELIKGKKLIARVLPTSDVLKSCEELGLNADNIIAMKGPFTEEINIATYRQYDIDLLITKESGVAGGFLEKINACKALNIPAVIITRKQIDYPKVINRIEDIEKIVSTFDAFVDVEKYATVVDVETIKENDCNLNISRYVDTTEEEEQVDIQKVLGEIAELEKKEAETKEKLNGYLKELGFDVL